MAIATDAIQKSIDQTKNFFTGKDLTKKWLKLAFILFLFALFTGNGISGNFGGNYSQSGADSSFSEFFEGMENGNTEYNVMQERDCTTSDCAIQPGAMPGNNPNFANLLNNIDWGTVAAWILVAIIVLMILAFILKIIGNAAFFTALKAIETNEVRIGLINNNFGKGLNLTILETALGLIGLSFVLMFIGAIFAAVYKLLAKVFATTQTALPALPVPEITGNIGLLIIIGIIGFAGLMVMGIISYFLNQFGVYIMHKTGKGAFTSLKEGYKIGTSDLKELGMLIIVQIILGVVIGVIAVLSGVLILIPLAIMVIAAVVVGLALGNIAAWIIIVMVIMLGILVLAYIQTVIITPVYVFIFRYNLNVLEGFITIAKKKGTISKVSKTAKK